MPTNIIKDKELRDLFKAESEEHIENLERGLVALEQNPQDTSMLESLFREAHSLKGSARMIGVNKVEILSHTIESLLAAAKEKKELLTADSTDRIYRVIDLIKQFVSEAVTGSVPTVSFSEALDMVKEGKAPHAVTKDSEKVISAEPQQEAAMVEVPQAQEASQTSSGPSAIEENPVEVHTEPIPLDVPITMKADQQSLAEVRPETQSEAQPESLQEEEPQHTASELTAQYRVNTIRVDAAKVDTLMAHAGELTVLKNRISRRLEEIDDITAKWEQLKGLMSGLSHNGGNGRELMKTTVAQMESLLGTLKGESTEDLRQLTFLSKEIEDGVHSLRLIPVSTVVGPFPRMVRDIARASRKEVELVVDGAETRVDKGILEEMRDPLVHMIRNAIDHGVETPQERAKSGKPRTARININARRQDAYVVLEVIDDGRGLDIDRIKAIALKRRIISEDDVIEVSPEKLQSIIFQSGFSTSEIITDISGRGIGLDVVNDTVRRMKGGVAFDSTPGKGLKITCRIPVTFSTTRVFIVKAMKYTFAIPIDTVTTTFMLSRKDIYDIDGMKTCTVGSEPVSVVYLPDLLGIERDISLSYKLPERLPCIVVSIDNRKCGIIVDELTDEQEVVVKQHGGILKRVINVSGSTILGNGKVAPVLNTADLVNTLNALSRGTNLVSSLHSEQQKRAQIILLAEDSITTRTQMKRVLEGGGYEVVTAIDGIDAYGKLKSQRFDALVSDVQMPNMDGLTLAGRVREDSMYQELPIILVTTMSSEEDKKRGIEAGANAYITKPTFDREIFLDTLRRLV